MNFETDLNNIEKVNNFIQKLPEEATFKEWTLSQLIIHLWRWDLEMIRLLEAQISGIVKSIDYDSLSEDEKKELRKQFQFEYQRLGITLNEWNELMKEKYEEKSIDELKTEFGQSRIKLLKSYRKHVDKFKNQPEATERTISLWKHDIHHLRKGGFDESSIWKN